MQKLKLLSETSDLAPVIFPYCLGPALLRFPTHLMWHQRLTLLATLPREYKVFENFAKVHERAQQMNHPATPVLNAVAYHIDAGGRTTDEATSPGGIVEVLDPKRTGMIFVEPRIAWEELDPILEHGIVLANSMLQDTQALIANAYHFMFRISQTLDDCGGDPVAAIQILDGRARALLHLVVGHGPHKEDWHQLGGWHLLMCETLVGRHTISKDTQASFSTDRPETVALLSLVGLKYSIPVERCRQAQPEHIAFTVFDSVFREYVSSIDSEKWRKVVRTTYEHSDALEAAKRKCKESAPDILDTANKTQSYDSVMISAVQRLKEEVADVLKVDRRAVTALFQKLTEDPKLWVTAAGYVASMFGGLPDLVSAGAGIGAIAIFGTSALKASRERTDALAKSPMRFAYYLKGDAK